uniref:Putative secreted peptide n=1 Tax=Anopheles braziliensis TaxID=58242 RepID=A0A2M3ZQH5_9DIPT
MGTLCLAVGIVIFSHLVRVLAATALFLAPGHDAYYLCGITLGQCTFDSTIKETCARIATVQSLEMVLCGNWFIVCAWCEIQSRITRVEHMKFKSKIRNS